MPRRPASTTRSRKRPQTIGRGFGKPVKMLAALLTIFGFVAASGAYYMASPDAAGGLETVVERSRNLLRSGGIGEGDTPSASDVFPRSSYMVGRVDRVVDGDTVVVVIGGQEEHVRLLNVDTPESVHPESRRNSPMGKVAADHTRKRLEGRQVRIEPDPGEKARDRYGRLLAYVIVEGENFNVELVRLGLSPYETQYGTSTLYDRQFRGAEEQARDARIGIWKGDELASLLP